jgi:hypothetical protein
MSRRTRTRQVTLATASVAALSVVFAGPAAASLWASTGSAAGNGKAGSTGAATSVTVPSSTVTNATVAVGWSGATGPAGATPTYFVERMAGALATPACGSTFAAPISGSSCSDTSVPNGSYTYRVTTRLGANWQATSGQSSTVTVTAAVVVTVGTPDLTAASDSGSSNTDNLTNVTSPTFTVAATTGASVQLFDNGVATGSPVTASGGSATVTAGTLTGGAGTSHPISAKATLSGTTVTSAALTIIVDTQAPQGLTITGAVTTGHAINYSGALGTASNDQAAATIIICASNTFPCGANNVSAKDLTPQSVTTTAGTWSFGSGNLGNNATNYAQVSQSDAAGNTATAVDGPRTS